MTNRVFDQRLQQQRGHRALRQFRRQLQAVLQARPHAHRDQFQVVAQAFELGLQAVRGGARGRQGGAQVGIEPVQHLGGGNRIGGNQRAQIGQRVEQHVRLELGLQQFEL